MAGGTVTEQTAWTAEEVRAAARAPSARGIAAWGGAVIVVAAVLAVRGFDSQRAFGEIAVGAGAASLYGVVAVAPSVLLVAAGVLAHWTRPTSRVGLLLIAEGLGWNIGTIAFSASYVPAAAEVSTLVVFLGYAIGAHVLLAYPDGRLRSRADRVLAALLYLVFGPGLAVTFMFHGAYGPGCPVCLANGFLVSPDATLDVAANAGWYAAGGLLITLAGLRSLPRWRAATVVARRSLAPVYLTRWALVVAIAVWCAIGAGLAVGDTTLWGLRVQVAINVAAIAAAAGIVVVFMRSTAARGAAGELARALDASNTLVPGRLEDAIRGALADPDARLLFAHPRTGAWLDSGGRPAAPRTDRSLTGVAPGSAIEHDPILDDDPTVVESVAAVAGLALETERLRALVRAHEAAPASAPGLGGVLTDREREVLALAADGLTDTAIAQRLYLTRRTVETHLGHIFAKLDVPAGGASNRRVHAVRRFLQATRQEP
jgi:DNA-binding CsgD family transcriptional regulator